MVGRRRQQPARGGKQERQRSVMFTLLVFVRMAAPVNHAQNSTNLRDRRQQADSDIAAAFIKTFQDLRRPDTNGAKRIGKAKIGQRIHQYNWREYFAPQTTLLHGVMADGPLRLNQRQAVIIHHLLQTFFILCRQPFGFCRSIIQVKPDHNA